MLHTTLTLMLTLAQVTVQPPAPTVLPGGAATAVRAVDAHLQKHPKQKPTAAKVKATSARTDAASVRPTNAAVLDKAPPPPSVKPAAKPEVKPAAKQRPAASAAGRR